MDNKRKERKLATANATSFVDVCETTFAKLEAASAALCELSTTVEYYQSIISEEESVLGVFTEDPVTLDIFICVMVDYDRIEDVEFALSWVRGMSDEGPIFYGLDQTKLDLLFTQLRCVPRDAKLEKLARSFIKQALQHEGKDRTSKRLVTCMLNFREALRATRQSKKLIELSSVFNKTL